MKSVVVSLIGIGVLVYLNYVLLYAASVEELFKRISVVLKRLPETGPKCKQSKCLMCLRQVKYLGPLVGFLKLRPDP